MVCIQPHTRRINPTMYKTSNSQGKGKCSRVNLTVIFESAIIDELDLGVYVCGHGKLTLTSNTTSSEQALVFL